MKNQNAYEINDLKKCRVRIFVFLRKAKLEIFDGDFSVKR